VPRTDHLRNLEISGGNRAETVETAKVEGTGRNPEWKSFWLGSPITCHVDFGKIRDGESDLNSKVCIVNYNPTPRCPKKAITSTKLSPLWFGPK
jgi:hypothetical protein